MYKRTQNDIILRIADHAGISPDPETTDYQAVLVWLADGNELAPADPLEPTPLAVTPWQMRKALNTTGLRNAVETAIGAADQTTIDAWAHAQEYIRTDAIVIGMGAALGKTEEEIDELFALARTL